MKYTYKDLVENVIETEYHDAIIDIDNHHIALKSDSGCLRRYWTVYVDGQIICTRAKFENGIRFAVKALNEEVSNV